MISINIKIIKHVKIIKYRGHNGPFDKEPK
jgi:hypothetical protein